MSTISSCSLHSASEMFVPMYNYHSDTNILVYFTGYVCSLELYRLALMSATVSGKEKYSPHICFVFMSNNLAIC